MLKTKTFSIALRVRFCAMFLGVLLPVTASGQRRWVVVRPHRSRIVVNNYRARPYVIYQSRPSYNYRYRSYTYSQPYYGNQYYSYRYSQPYFANSCVYSYANPTYYYERNQYRPRHRHNRFRVNVWLR